mmetsp:Transcript_42099/g.112263  ORF Transcript_42099/g.112263 Transcript_42099/m.112263 type:complete len:172 (+) Transcript_42099:90-605(+)
MVVEITGCYHSRIAVKSCAWEDIQYCTVKICETTKYESANGQSGSIMRRVPRELMRLKRTRVGVLSLKDQLAHYQGLVSELDERMDDLLAPFREEGKSLTKALDLLDTEEDERKKQEEYWAGGEGPAGDVSAPALERFQAELEGLRAKLDVVLEGAEPDLDYFKKGGTGDY